MPHYFFSTSFVSSREQGVHCGDAFRPKSPPNNPVVIHEKGAVAFSACSRALACAVKPSNERGMAWRETLF